MKVQVSPEFAFETDHFAAIRVTHPSDVECCVDGLPVSSLPPPLEYYDNRWVTLKWYEKVERELAEKAVALFAESKEVEKTTPMENGYYWFNGELNTLGRIVRLTEIVMVSGTVVQTRVSRVLIEDLDGEWYGPLIPPWKDEGVEK